MEIRNKQSNPSPQIDHSEIFIPDSEHLGTGEYKVALRADALAQFPIASQAINAPVFQISLNVNRGPVVSVLLGRADQSQPKSRKVFKLPTLDTSKSHTLIAYFENWTVARLELDGAPTAMQPDPNLN